MTLQDLGGLEFNPFSMKQGDLAGKFVSGDLTQAQLRVKRTAKEGGICLLAGDPGKGISFAASCCITELEGLGLTVKYMSVKHVSTRDFYKSLCRQVETDPKGKSRGALIDSIYEREKQLKAQSRPLFMVLDNAQNIPRDALADLPQLICSGHPPELLSSILMCGTKDMRHMVRANPSIRPFVSDFYTMGGLTSEETEQYVLHKLRLAGASEPILTDDAMDALYSYSASGNYRMINNLMKDALYLAVQAGKKQIDKTVIVSSATHQF